MHKRNITNSAAKQQRITYFRVFYVLVIEVYIRTRPFRQSLTGIVIVESVLDTYITGRQAARYVRYVSLIIVPNPCGVR